MARETRRPAVPASHLEKVIRRHSENRKLIASHRLLRTPSAEPHRSHCAPPSHASSAGVIRLAKQRCPETRQPGCALAGSPRAVPAPWDTRPTPKPVWRPARCVYGLPPRYAEKPAVNVLAALATAKPPVPRAPKHRCHYRAAADVPNQSMPLAVLHSR